MFYKHWHWIARAWKIFDFLNFFICNTALCINDKTAFYTFLIPFCRYLQPKGKLTKESYFDGVPQPGSLTLINHSMGIQTTWLVSHPAACRLHTVAHHIIPTLPLLNEMPLCLTVFSVPWHGGPVQGLPCQPGRAAVEGAWLGQHLAPAPSAPPSGQPTASGHLHDKQAHTSNSFYSPVQWCRPTNNDVLCHIVFLNALSAKLILHEFHFCGEQT